MLEAPAAEEWLFVYLLLGLALLVAVAVETTTGRIPNLLTLPALAYLLTARLALSADGWPWYLLGLALSAALVIGVGWGCGYLGGGAAKMAVAVSAALPPLLGLSFSSALVLTMLGLHHTQRWHQLRQVRGSLLLLLLTGAVVALLALAGRGLFR